MTKLLVCVDGSAYADNICINAAWVAKRMDASIELLHVLRRHSDYQAPSSDLTGSIGLGARSSLLAELARVDEQRGALDQEKGRVILKHSETILRDAGMEKVQSLHRRGSLVDTIKDLEDSVDMIFIGKRGEHASPDSEFLGANLEKTVRSIRKPIFLVSSVARPIKRFLIAYDGNDSARKAVDFIAGSALLKGLEGHLLAVGSAGDIDTDNSASKLTAAGIDLKVAQEERRNPDRAIADYVDSEKIDLLITGAYSHSRVRSLLLGSTTAAMIKTCKVPLLLFR